MNTSFQTLYKLFLNSIQDYRIKNLLTDAETINVAEDMMETFLIKAIPKFTNCVKDIQTVDLVGKTFNVELDLTEINILVDLMIISWLQWNINDILQMNLTLNDCFIILKY